MSEFSTEAARTICPCCGPILAPLGYYPSYHFTCVHGSYRAWALPFDLTGTVVYKLCEVCETRLDVCQPCNGRGVVSNPRASSRTETSGRSLPSVLPGATTLTASDAI